MLALAASTARHRAGGGLVEAAPGSGVTSVGPSIDASPTPGSAGVGNLITITAAATIAVNGTAIGGANVSALYYIDHTAFQLGNNSWWGPITATNTGATNLPASPKPTVLLSGTNVPAGSGSNTVIGAITVTTGTHLATVTTGVYTWALSIGAGSAAGYGISGTNLITTTGSSVAGTVNIVATNAAVTGSPFSFSFPITVGVVGSHSIPQGAYVDHIWGGASKWNTFKAYFPGLTTPFFFTDYMDHTNAASGWASYGTSLANAFNISGANPASNTIPQIAWGMGTSANPSIFSAIIAGTYDSAFQTVVQAFANVGYSSIVFRLSHEMNQGNFPWPVNSGNASTWVSAWRHMANVLHAAGTTYGITVLTNWCPASGLNQNDNSCTIAQYYPGDAYVDQYGMDQYDAPVGGALASIGGSANNYQVNNMISLATAAGKPFSWGEIGISTTGWANDFVTTVRNNMASNPGSTCAFICWWDTTSSGDYLFADNPSVVPIIQANFGANGSIKNP